MYGPGTRDLCSCAQGGLQEEDFDDLFKAIGLYTEPESLARHKEIGSVLPARTFQPSVGLTRPDVGVSDDRRTLIWT